MKDEKEACVETIWIHKGRVQRMAYHQQRYEQTMRAYFADEKVYNLRKLIQPLAIDHQDVKCRVVYNEHELRVEYQAYERRPIARLKVVQDDHISYEFKTASRPHLDALFAQRGQCDEILICKNGMIADAYYYNVVFENKDGLFTPKTPLLLGTQRQYLIDRGLVNVADISLDQLHIYDTVYLINSLNVLGKIKLQMRNIIL
jgi:4-amino-4-deoxychorismate lyase